MKLKRKKILLLYCGGLNLPPQGTPRSWFLKWLKTMPELKLMAEINPVFVFGGRGEEITPLIWQKIAKEIFKKINSYDGFIVIHGPSRALFSAAALSFAVQNLNKPIVFTGVSQEKEVVYKNIKDIGGIFGEYNNLGIKANLVNALQVATTNLPEVGLMFGNQLVKAVWATKSKESSFNIFDSLKIDPLAKIDFGIRLPEKKLALKNKKQGSPKLIQKFDSNIQILELNPTLTPEELNKLCRKSSGLIIKIPFGEKIPAFLIKLGKENKCPIIIFDHLKIIKSKPEGLVVIQNITPESLITKFMLALGQTKDKKKIKKIMLTNYLGEFINE